MMKKEEKEEKEEEEKKKVINICIKSLPLYSNMKHKFLLCKSYAHTNLIIIGMREEDAY
jgi:hypothetical protein